MIRIVFFGTPAYTLPLINVLHKNFKEKDVSSIAAVVTQPPKPAGRKGHLKYSAIDTWAHKRNIPIFFDPEKAIEKTQANLGILASYGKIVTNKVINHFPNGILNFHPSLLPSFRGASPVQAAIVEGLKETGGTIISLDQKMDHGPIVTHFTQVIKSTDTTKTLRDTLFERSAEVLVNLIPPFITGKVNTKDQEHNKASFTTLVRKADGFIESVALQKALDGKKLNKKWNINFIKDYSTVYTPATIERFVRAMKPWPIAWSKIKIQNKNLRIKIIKAHLEEKPSRLVLDEVQLEGKNKVNWKQFKEGYPNARF